jgi:hypothetical protein
VGPQGLVMTPERLQRCVAVDILTDIPCFKCLFWESIRQCDVNACQKLMDWLLIQVEECHRTEEALVDVNTSLRRRIQELLTQHPWTASSLGQTLRRDRSQVRKLLRMEHQGLVTCTAEQGGRVVYKFWRLLES